ncbi:ATP-grasp domain-containing protein [Staphylococcus sp. ACRSN]|uniref:L-aspartate--L-methionine ligase LdmS n=1 Tax=Staphylococcus sp. ACRSN TaxID=2918214 RepID=UPI001EF347C3|nr:ATP-grasp domain-containing protein [Staphylococcus sp. ACRSN]MCG7339985.1 ATP-grasp domain-containing protein [Staphylococcus sp. ACRSN]
MTRQSSLRPKMTLSDLYDSNIVYTSRPSYISNPWLEPEEHQSNFLTGRELLIANQMPVIVHEASVTEKLAQLFRLIGKDMPKNIYQFNDKTSYEQLLTTLAQDLDKKIYFQYIHDESILNKDYYALNKDTFISLNNKSRIPEWTNNKYLPKREVVNIEDFEQAIQHWAFPFVLKPGDDLPTAGGYGVMICYDELDLKKASERIEKAKYETDTIIIEQKVEAVANYCVQFAYTPKLGVQYIGTSQQLTDKYGHYNGNLNVQNVPSKVIQAGKEIMEIGVAQGYYGVAGFDLLEDKHGDIFAIDLNFRQNGSTSMLLLEPVLTQGFHKFYSYQSLGDNDHFFNTIVKYIKQGVLFPLSYYDGNWYETENVQSRFGCIWHGDSQQQIEKIELQFLKDLNKV